jgi:multiple sugar transport system substrate-binding protein
LSCTTPGGRGADRKASMRRYKCLLQASTLAAAAAFAAVALTSSCGEGDARAITFWQFWPSRQIEPLLQRFEVDHPGLEVRMQQLTWGSGFEKIVAAAAAGSPPDLCELGSTWLARFASEGALADVTEETAPLRGEYRMWEIATYRGRVFGWPWVLGTRALFFNRDLFERAGLDPERPPETWAQMLDAARRISEIGDGYYGFGLNAGERYVTYKKFMAFAWGNGGRILSEDLTRSRLDSPENREALSFYVDLIPYSMIERQDMIDQAFKEGRVGMMVSGAWNLKRIPVEAPSLRYGVALVPRPDAEGGVHASFGGGEVLVVFSASKRKGPAGELARFLVSPQNEVALCRNVRSVQPSFVDAERDPYYASNPNDLIFVRQLRTAVSPPAVPEWMEMEGVIDEAVEQAIHGARSPADALAEADGRLNDILQPKR